MNVSMDDLRKNDKSVGKQNIVKTLSSLFDKGKISPNGNTVVATNEQVMSYGQFQWYKRINETIDALVGVTFTDEDGIVRNTADDLNDFLEKPWEERFGTIASFRRCSDRGYFFAETDIQLHPYPLCKEPAYEQVWTQLQIVPEWVLKHFSILEFIGGVDIDDVA